MKNNSPSGHTGMMGKSHDMLKGLSRKSPAGVDASMAIGKARVNDGAVRDAVAATPPTLGPRDA